MTTDPTRAQADEALMRQALDALEELAYSNSTPAAVSKFGTVVPALRQRLASDAQPLEAKGWRTMDSAPKDGTKFLAFRPLAEKTHDPVISIVEGRKVNRGCWEDTIPAGMDSSNFTSGYCKPTHWQPLPPPPAQSEGSRG